MFVTRCSSFKSGAAVLSYINYAKTSILCVNRMHISGMSISGISISGMHISDMPISGMHISGVPISGMPISGIVFVPGQNLSGIVSKSR